MGTVPTGRVRVPTPLTGSVRVKDSLIFGNLLANGSRFGGSRMIGIRSWRQTAELYQTGHQQQSSLRRGQIRAADE